MSRERRAERVSYLHCNADEKGTRRERERETDRQTIDVRAMELKEKGVISSQTHWFDAMSRPLTMRMNTVKLHWTLLILSSSLSIIIMIICPSSSSSSSPFSLLCGGSFSFFHFLGLALCSEMKGSCARERKLTSILFFSPPSSSSSSSVHLDKWLPALNEENVNRQIGCRDRLTSKSNLRREWQLAAPRAQTLDEDESFISSLFASSSFSAAWKQSNRSRFSCSHISCEQNNRNDDGRYLSRPRLTIQR